MSSGAVRLRKACNRLGLRFVGDLLQTPRHKLAEVKNFGDSSRERLEEVLASKGLALEMPLPAELLAAYRDWKAKLPPN